jgi:hypothetical protein
VQTKTSYKLSKILHEVGGSGGLYNKGSRNYLSNMVTNMNSPSSNTVMSTMPMSGQDSSLMTAHTGSNTNHRHPKMPRFSSSKNLKIYKYSQAQGN